MKSDEYNRFCVIYLRKTFVMAVFVHWLKTSVVTRNKHGLCMC
uniref:Uncharacterized protein n=1 Tax=Anguilla anguilla TaxID=7936 RepID=A0A0E9VG47_ANGAN